MKVVCISKAHHMWNYTEGKTYNTSVDDMNNSFWQGTAEGKLPIIDRENATTISDDRGMSMYWNISDMKLYFIPLREHNLKQFIL